MLSEQRSEQRKIDFSLRATVISVSILRDVAFT